MRQTALATTFIQDSTRVAPELGPIFRRTFFNLEFTFVWDVDLVAELSDERRFTKHVHPNLAVLRQVIGDGLITAHSHEPNWRAGHEVLASGFTQSAMRRHHRVMLDVAGELTDVWDQGVPVDVASDMTKTTLEVIGRAGFGYSFDSFGRQRPHPFVVALTDSMLHGLRTVTRPPVIGGLLGKRAEQRNADDIAYLHGVVDDVIAARHGDPGDDLLGLMLASDALDPVNIRYQALTFLAAGHETTSGTLAIALYYLANNPAILASARAEVATVWRDDVPSFEQVGKLRYLRRVVDETLRLWPTAPGYSRQAKEDTVLGDVHPMRAGDSLFVLTPALHRAPVWGTDPDTFDPDRFTREQVRQRPPHVFKPFGTGERACIGRQFALHQVTLVLGLLLRRYDLHPEPDYRLRVQELITFRPVGFTLGVTRR